MESRLYIIFASFYSTVRKIFPRISWHDLPCHKTMGDIVFVSDNFSIAPAEFLDSNIFSLIVHNIFACLTFSLSTTQMDMVKARCRFYQINFFHENFPSRIDVLFLACQFLYRPHTQKRIVLCLG